MSCSPRWIGDTLVARLQVDADMPSINIPADLPSDPSVHADLWFVSLRITDTNDAAAAPHLPPLPNPFVDPLPGWLPPRVAQALPDNIHHQCCVYGPLSESLCTRAQHGLLQHAQRGVQIPPLHAAFITWLLIFVAQGKVRARMHGIDQ